MQITVTGRHLQVTDAMRDHVYAKVQQRLADIPRILDVHLIVAIEKYRHIAEVVLHAPDHARFESRAESDDMYVSIDTALDKMHAQLRHHHDRAYNHKAREKLGEIEAETEALEVPGAEETPQA